MSFGGGDSWSKSFDWGPSWGPLSFRSAIDPIHGLFGDKGLLTGLMPSTPEMPAVAPLVPIKDDTALQNAAKLEAERLKKRKGMKATILTQDSGLMTSVQTGKAQALGG